ncbi:MAG TPA: M12 family metallo-peptidase [Thermoanaerobaculia bacterium]|nr:M12 family metallo-peptidase [Thermoanaerobaculia bacterium]
MKIRALGMAAAMGFMAVAASAAGNELFTSLDISGPYGRTLTLDASYQALAGSPATGSLQVVRANPDLVTLKTASLNLNLEPGFTLRAHRTNSYVANTGSLIWTGVIEDFDSAAVPFSADNVRFDANNTIVMVKSGKTLTANVHYNGEWYKIRPLRTGGHAIVAVNYAAMPPDHPEEDYRQIYHNSKPMREVTDKAVGDTVIRIMVHYTSSAATASGNIGALIDLAVAETNTGYDNSGVLIDMVLAHKSQVTYTQSGSFSTDLSRYRGTSDGYMDSVHTTRNSVAADVALLVINNSSSCGLASGIGSTASTAFADAHWDCITGYYSFGHEIGHLQSARHDPANDPSTSPYSYGHGYQYNGNPKWRTIMAYNCSGGCPRLNYWSNPNKLYNGVPMGTTSQSDNARVLNLTRGTVAAFR